MTFRRIAGGAIFCASFSSVAKEGPRMTQGYNARYFVFVVALAQLSIAVPNARAQYLYVDTNGDGVNSSRQNSIGDQVPPTDCLTAATSAIDIYFVTDHNADGSTATCFTEDPLTIQSYQFILGFSGVGEVVASGWTDSMGFTEPGIGGGDGTFAAAGQEVWVGRKGEELSPGLYKVGTLALSVVGTPMVFFKAASSGSFPAAQTSFGSACPGSQQNHIIQFGVDATEAFGACCFCADPVVTTTWGKIKRQYR